jgi:hypothetical protein
MLNKYTKILPKNYLFNAKITIFIQIINVKTPVFTGIADLFPILKIK